MIPQPGFRYFVTACWPMNHIVKAINLAKLFTVGIFISLSSQAQTFLTNGLVAYYPFNGNANDASGNGINGTVHAATLSTNFFGIPNTAYSFPGTNIIDS